MTAIGRHTPRQRTAPIILAAAALLLFPALLLAEPPPPADPPLRGPEVSDRDIPGPPGDFGSDQARRRFADRIPLRVFREAVRTFAGDDAPADLRLTEDQSRAIRRHLREFDRDRREYMAEREDELRRLREQANPRPPRPPRNPDADAAPQDAMTPARREALDRLREIERAAPQPESLYAKIWEELTPAQRDAVEARLEAFRQQRAKEREEQYVRRRAPRDGRPETMPDEMDRRTPTVEGSSRPDRPRRRGPDDAAANQHRERIDRLIRVFEQLPPDAQEQLLRRLEARVAELRAGDRPDRPDPEGPARRPRRRPPPSMDEVDVPSPDGSGRR